MPIKKKPVTKLPTEQAIEKLFPKSVLSKVKRIVSESDQQKAKKPKKS